MNHQDINQKPMSQDQVKELKDMVKELQRDKERNAEPEDPYVTTRIPLTDLAVYSELIEALPSIEKDFFHTVTQGRLDNLHKGMRLSGKLEKLGAHIVSKKPEKRSRIRKPFLGRQQFGTQNGTSSKPAQAQTAEAVTPTATANNHSQHRPHGRVPGRGPPRNVSVSMGQIDGQQVGSHYRREGVPDPVPEKGKNFEGLPRKPLRRALMTGPPQKKNERCRSCRPDVGSRIPAFEERNRTCQDTGSRILQQLVRHTKEDLGTQISPRPAETEPACGGKEFQDGILFLDLPTNPPKGLHDVSGYRGCGAPIWTFAQLPHIHQGSSPDIEMCENTWDRNLGIFRRSHDLRRDEGSLRSKNFQNLFQDCETRLQDQARGIKYETMSVDNSPRNGHQFSEYDAQSFFIQGPGPKKGSLKAIECGSNDPNKFRELHWESPSNVNCTVIWPPYAKTSSRTEEKLFIENKIMDIDCHIDSVNLSFWVHKLKSWNGQSFLPKTPELEIFTDSSDTAWGIVVGSKFYSSLWSHSEALMYINAKDLLTILYTLRLRNVVCRSVLVYSDNTTTLSHISKFDGTTSPKLLEISENIWNYCLRTNTRPQVIYAPSVMNPADPPSRLTEQTKWSISDQTFKKISGLYGIHDVDLFASWTNKKVELFYSWFSDSSNPVMENGNMLSGSPETISLTTATTTGNNRNTKPKKQKITAIEQQELVSYGVENQRSFLKTQGLSDSTINIIVSSERSLKRRSRYYSTQQNFLEWNLNNNQSSDILPGHVVNYLAHLFTARKLSVKNIKS
ncbi:hypothetical protein AYI70_g5622 [Smittium culicis]|uniref:Uncharacterized protein n=1 Tax=Smittium culicis TaxID=133412 RepID=A0A1R1XTM0_9FUNG|nr:hypothetical protein AYI70_g5622 [Smittium culicis]